MPAGRAGVLRRCAKGGSALAAVLLLASLASRAVCAAPAEAPGPVSPVSATPETPASPTRQTAPANPPAAGASQEPKQEVSIEAPEPRYVAPTLRDRIGRIWAPVMIDGKGPFRLVLDTGASHSAVIASVVQALGVPLDASLIRLRGVTATAIVPTIHVASLRVGDLETDSEVLPIVPDALGGAQGVLGTEGLLDKRIYIDFQHDLITIKRSRRWRSRDFGFVSVPVKISRDHLLTTTVHVGWIRATAIIDTGAQVSIANLALREALIKRRPHHQFTTDKIVDTTDAEAEGKGTQFPPINLGGVQITGAHITTGNMQIFDDWKLTETPAILIGMDALGLVDTLVIDYPHGELEVRTRPRSSF